jgi:pantoate ligase / CMP/dCMP kinase
MSLPIFTTPHELNDYLQLWRTHSLAESPLCGIGFVPTMGALHLGHQSLIDRARQENTQVIVSIFVNPLQFGANEDLDRYPRQLELDQAMCEQAGVDVLFIPTATSMGLDLSTNDVITQVIPPPKMIGGLCGRSRVGHFQGVATIVTKLLNIVRPDRAYFGEKDAQQLAIIRRIVKDLNLSVEIVGCPTLRAESGLALSSRNQYLSAAGKSQAPVIYRSLQQAALLVANGERDVQSLLMAVTTELDTTPEFQLEYLELVESQTLQPIKILDRPALIAIAGRIENTRLIDNMMIGGS